MTDYQGSAEGGSIHSGVFREPDRKADTVDELLYDLANFYTKRGKQGYRLDGSDYEGHSEAKARLYDLLMEVIGEDENIYDTEVKANNKSPGDYLRAEQRQRLDALFGKEGK